MTSSNAIPVWASVLLFIAFSSVSIGIVALAGSKKYAKRVPNVLKIALAFVCSQAVAMYFLPLIHAINFLPGLLSESTALMAAYVGDALGIVWAMPSGITICYALMPKNRAGTYFGLLSFILMCLFTTLFLVTSAMDGHSLTALLYGLSLLFGLIALFMALSRRKKKR